MQISINENGCLDREVAVLDTKLPYYYAKVCELFTFEPEEVCVHIVGDMKSFCELKGEGPECDDGAFVKGNTIFIFEPNQFGVATKAKREDFYRVLYQELVHLFYQTNKYN